MSTLPATRDFHDHHDFERVRRRQYPRRQAGRRHDRPGDRQGSHVAISTNGSISAWPAPAAARSRCGSSIAAAPPIPTAGPTIAPACRSTARNGSASPDTSYADGVLTIRFDARDRPASGSPISRLIRWSGTTTWSSTVAALPGVDYRSPRQEPRRPGHRLPDHRRGRRSTSGSTPASIPARRWPNGGWKARSKS